MASKTKVLDLDKFGEDAGRTLTIGGVAYPVIEMTVDNFIETTKEAARLEKEGASMAEQIDAMVSMISRSIPTVPETELRKLSLIKLGIVVNFLQGKMDQLLEEAAEAAAESGDEAVKK